MKIDCHISGAIAISWQRPHFKVKITCKQNSFKSMSGEECHIMVVFLFCFVLESFFCWKVW